MIVSTTTRKKKSNKTGIINNNNKKLKYFGYLLRSACTLIKSPLSAAWWSGKSVNSTFGKLTGVLSSPFPP